MEEHQPATTPNERKGLALASLIMSGAALLCAFITSWYVFSIIISVAALGALMLTRGRNQGHTTRNMKVASVIIALVAIGFSAYCLWTRRGHEKADGTGVEIPAELKDTGKSGPPEEALDRLRQSMDTTSGQQ